MKIDSILSYFSTGILFINVILYLIGLKQNNLTYKVFLLYLLLSLILQVASTYYAMQGLANHFLSTYFFILRYILLTLFFYNLFKDFEIRFIKKYLFYSSFTTAIIITFQYIVKPDLYYNFNAIGFLITSILLVSYALIYLYFMLTRTENYLYIVLGMLIYFISSSIIFITASDIISLNNQLNYYIWIANALLYLSYQILILHQWKKQFYLKETLR